MQLGTVSVEVVDALNYGTKLVDDERRRWYAALEATGLVSNLEGLAPEVVADQLVGKPPVFPLTLEHVDDILYFVFKIGYIDYEKHEGFLKVMKLMDKWRAQHVQNLRPGGGDDPGTIGR